MGKRGKTKRYHEGPSKPKGVAYQDETPDPESRSFYYDEVDEFTNERQQVPLSRAGKKKRAELLSDGKQELFSVRVDSDPEEEEDEESLNQDERDSDMDSDIVDKKNEEDYLPSADAWGRKRKDYYNTDYVDEDYGGFSGSDAEAAEMEEEEALRIQKKMKDQIREEDYMLDFDLPEISTKKENENEEDQIIGEEPRKDKTGRDNEEVKELVKEYNLRRNVIVNQLEPLLEGVKQAKVPRNSGIKLLLNKLEIYTNYLLNVQFYLYLKSETGVKTENHPVLDRIIDWKELVTKIDVQTQHLDGELIEVLKQLRKGSDLMEIMASSEVSDPDSNDPKSLKRKRKLKENDEELMEENEWNEEFADGLVEGNAGEDEKRAINYEMAKNKGLTPRRKKEQRNPRVKHRGKYRKALIRKRGQMPDMRQELSRYAGEARGIKIGVVKSVKLA